MKDLRYKLTDSQRNEIKVLWKAGLRNYTQIGRMFNVHAKTVRKVVEPGYREKCNSFNRENWERYKPSKKHHAELMRNYRKRKKLKLILDIILLNDII